MQMADPYKSARRQLRDVAKLLKLDDEIVKRLSKPNRFIEVNFPVKMDNGEVKIFTGYRSQHNNNLGPYKGGLRFSPQVSPSEVKALSMWMSWKCAVAGIPMGGGKGGVVVNTKVLSQKELKRLSEGFIASIADIIGPKKDIPAPDMYTTPQIMEWMVRKYSRIVGKNTPAVITGKPLTYGGSQGRTEATGQGGVYVLNKMAKLYKLNPKNTTLTVQGVGNVGYYFSTLAVDQGYKIIALSDSTSAIYNKNGLDVKKAFEYKEKQGSFKGFTQALEIDNTQLLELKTDVLIPAAVENVITARNADKIKAKYIIELANGPTTPKADGILQKRRVVVIPDVLANSGGVIVSYLEWLQNIKGEKWDKKLVNKKLKTRIDKAFDEVELSKKTHKSSFRIAAYLLAVKKVADKLKY